MDSKNVLECIETRRSVRKYLPDQIPDDVLQRIVRAGTFAPTGINTQSPIMIVIRNKEMRDRLMEMNKQVLRVKFGSTSDADPFYGAPCVIAVLADRSKMTHLEDGSLVIANLMLAAHAEGIGSCWIHRCREEFDWAEGKALLKELGIEGDYEGIGHVILGYPDGPEPKAAPGKENYAYFVD